MTEKERAFGMIGLAARAGKVVSGSDSVIGAIRSGNVKLLIITRDISENSLDKILRNITGEKMRSPVTVSEVQMNWEMH